MSSLDFCLSTETSVRPANRFIAVALGTVSLGTCLCPSGDSFLSSQGVVTILHPISLFLLFPYFFYVHSGTRCPIKDSCLCLWSL